MRRVLILATSLVCLLQLPARTSTPSCDWPMYGRDPGHSFAQQASCTELDLARAATMSPKWFVRTDDSVTASPSVVDGIVYAGSWDGTFRAVDAEDGEVLWTFQIDDDQRVAFGRIVSSAWVGDLRFMNSDDTVPVVLFGGGATLYALRAGRAHDGGGTLLAKFDVDPRGVGGGDDHEVEIESSPVVGSFPDGDRIFVGMDVHNEPGVGPTGLLSFQLRENVHGYELVFKYKFDPETSSVRASPTDGVGTGWGCGGVWSSPVVHPTALGPGDGVVVFGTANCPSPASSPVRESMWGIRAKTGELLWRYTPPRPAGFDPDDDFGASPNLLPGGMVGEGSKDGWYYARDLVTGAERWSARVAQSGHAGEGFAIGGILGSTAVGKVAGAPAIFATSAFPTPANDRSDGLDGSLLDDPTRVASVHAIDAATGRILWRQPLSGPSYGAPTYANGVLLVPDTFTLQLLVLDANTGTVVRAIPLPGAPSSAPAIVGESVYLGIGTRETDAEFKRFGNELEDLFSGTVGEHPLSRLSGIAAFKVILEEEQR